MEDSSISDSFSGVTTPGSQPPQSQSQGSRALAPRPSENGSGPGPGSSHPGAAGASSAPKKRVAQTSRGVATMTPDRLARKRANDREAQRAVRERTKAQIRELQDEVSVLKSDQAQLQHILQENSALQAENTAMKQAMAQLVHQLDSQSINQQQSSLQHHQHHHEHHHHHHNHQGLQYQQQDSEQKQEYPRKGAPFSPGPGEPSKPSFHQEHSAEHSNLNNHPNCCNPGSSMMLPGIEEMTRRPFHTTDEGSAPSHGPNPSKHESNMAHQRENFERHSFRDQLSFKPMEMHRQKHQHYQHGYPSSSYRQAMHHEASRSIVSSTRINLDDLPKVSASVGDFETPSAEMISALESFYEGTSDGRAGGGDEENWNGNGKQYKNGGFNDTSMGNSDNGKPP